jgi:hypothetical protein
MTIEPSDWIRDLLSPSRLSSYQQACGGVAEAAIKLYEWNIGASITFYRPLHFLEGGVRNALHGQLLRRYGRGDWWSVAPLTDEGKHKIRTTIAQLARPGAGPPGDDGVVAALTFGFWVALLGRKYDRGLWVPTLHKAFPYYRGRRQQLHYNLETMRFLRNRVMHYEPIYRRDLADDHAILCQLLSYFSPDAAREVACLDQISDLLARRDEILNIPAPRCALDPQVASAKPRRQAG